ncbi:hypothetical protein CR513_36188, partial [Mucuna pruriens]
MVIEDQFPRLEEWVLPTNQKLDNWIAEALPELIDNTILKLNNINESSGQDEGEGPEEEALKGPKLQSGAKELEIINLGKKEEAREIRVGKQLSPDLRQRLVELLKKYIDIFSWSYRDMPGLDTTIVEHKLPLIPNIVPIRQEFKRMKPIKEEVEKQWNAGFLTVEEYPQWVGNIVSVPKKDGKVQMCVDYRDLNRASPKDNFPLPHIDMLVDNTTQHAFYSFMDGFSRCNQI